MQRSEIGQPLRGDDRTDQERGKRGANQKESRHDRAHIDAHAVAAVHEQRRSSARPILSVSHIRIDEHEGERGRADEEPRTPDQGLREHRLEADFAEPEEVGGKGREPGRDDQRKECRADQSEQDAADGLDGWTARAEGVPNGVGHALKM